MCVYDHDRNSAERNRMTRKEKRRDRDGQQMEVLASTNEYEGRSEIERKITVVN